MDYLSFAKETVLAAGKIALGYFNKKHDIFLKEGAINFATEADLACEKFIFEKIKKQYPHHSFLSEEMGFVKRDSIYTWVLDPIDGTVNFSRGLPWWGVSLALFKNAQPIIGTIYLPPFDEIYFAEKGKGAYGNDKKISVSGENILSRSLIIVEFGYPERRKEQKLPVSKFFKEFPAIFLTPLSSVYDLVSVAKGRVDGFIEEHPLIWDVAAGALIVAEAGGRISDWKGNRLEYELDGKKFYQIIASNGKVHEDILGYLT